jgi:hypothetical protein
MRQLSDTLLARIKSGVVVLGRAVMEGFTDRSNVIRSYRQQSSRWTG